MVGPGLTENKLLAAELRPLALAMSCLLLPVTSISRSEKATVPLPAAQPMSRVVVPCNGPVPPLKVSVTFRLAGSPTIEVLPNASRVWTTGWMPKGEPAVALPGWVVKASAPTAAGPMAMVLELVPVRPVELKLIVMLVATLWARLL